MKMPIRQDCADAVYNFVFFLFGGQKGNGWGLAFFLLWGWGISPSTNQKFLVVGGWVVYKPILVISFPQADHKAGQ